MDDVKIIELYFSRDERAIAETEGKYGPYCFAVANNILSDRGEAEESVNDTWLRAWNSMPPQRPKVLKLFLARIARNISLDRYRARSAQKRGGETALAIEELGEVASSCDVFGEVMEREAIRLIRGFVHALPETERNLFVRRYFFLESAGSIAQRYGLSEGAVNARLGRTRKKLKVLLEKELN